MRIIWNPQFKQFEAQLTSGEHWVEDQQAVKSAKFLTEGPPEWKWLAFQARNLTKLKALSPTSGITITPEALEHYKRLKELEDKNAAVKAELKAAKKEQKTKSSEDPTKGFKMMPGPEGFLVAEVDPGESRIWTQYVPPPLPTTLCHVCQIPVWSYEAQDPPTCLDCEFDLGL